MMTRTWKSWRWAPLALALLVGGCENPGTPKGVAPAGDQQTQVPQLPERPDYAPPLDPDRKPWTGPRVRVVRLATDGIEHVERLMWKCDPVFYDVNKDGNMDLGGIPRLGRGPRVWFGRGDGTWEPASNGLETADASCGGGIAFGDINNDGHTDLAVADHCQGVFVYLGDGEGNWRATTRALYPKEQVPPKGVESDYLGAEDIDLGDVNGDGFLDIAAVSNDAAGVQVYHGDGTGENWKRESQGLLTKGPANRVLLQDISRDEHLDLIMAHCDGPRVWWGDGYGRWKDMWDGLPTPNMGCLFRGTDIGDVDEDGRLDFATANWVDGPEVYFQQADGSWKKSADVFPEMLGGAVGVAMGDINQDGHLDMVVSGRLSADLGVVYGVHLLYGDGKGNWYYDHESGLPTTGLKFTWGVALGDVNNDGTLDIAAGSGGNVATNPEFDTKAIEEHLLVWTTRIEQP